MNEKQLTVNALDSFYLPFKYSNAYAITHNFRDRGDFKYCLCKGSDCVSKCRNYTIITSIPSSVFFYEIIILLTFDEFTIDISPLKIIKVLISNLMMETSSLEQ